MKKNLGLVHVYTGNGKGKTTWALGIAMRALGQGLKVSIIQFMKGGAYTGEYISAKNFLSNVNFMQFGKQCVKEQKQMKLQGIDSDAPLFDYIREDIDCGDCRDCFVNDDEQKKFVKDAFNLSKKVITSGDYNLVVLDEINVALNLGFLKLEDVLSLIKNKFEKTELVLTGRNAPKELFEVADYASDIQMIKHPFNKGVLARRGIEY